MKASNLTTTAKKTGLVLLTVFLLTAASNAQSVKKNSYKLDKAAIENLTAGIKSLNNGVKKDCIYFSAIYGVQEAVDVLKTELENEKNPSTRALIALALFKLGVQAQTEELSGYVTIDWDERIRDINSEFEKHYKNSVTSVSKKK